MDPVMTKARPITQTATVAVLAWSACGCQGPPPWQGGFHSPDVAAKLYAVRQAGEARDASAIGDLVEQLDHDDPLVRMMAIQALERITGTRLGYDPYAGPQRRQDAVDRWVEAARTGRYDAAPTTAGPDEQDAPDGRTPTPDQPTRTAR